jgi:hypothetical protein
MYADKQAGTNLAYRRRSLGRYSSLTDQNHRVISYYYADKNKLQYRFYLFRIGTNIRPTVGYVVIPLGDKYCIKYNT